MNKKKCKSCDWVLSKHEEEYPTMNKKNPRDVELAQEYCDNHESVYGSLCEPKWCKECGHLDIYLVTVTEASRKIEPKF